MSYRHPRYHNQKTLLEPYQAIALALFVLIPLPLAILFIAAAAKSATPVPAAITPLPPISAQPQ